MVKFLVIHCSDTPTGREHTAEDIHNWHVQRGFDGIGYNAVIQINGKVEQGRPDYWTGAHVAGHNAESLGVCLIGEGDFTEAQQISLLEWLGNKLEQHPNAKIVGHGQLDSKKSHCPGFDVSDWLECHGLGRFKL